MKREDIEKIAGLARVRLDASEAETLVKDIDAILAYVSQIAQEEGGEELFSKKPIRNVTRKDGTPHPAGEHTETLLAEAPQTEEGYITVKSILSRE